MYHFSEMTQFEVFQQTLGKVMINMPLKKIGTIVEYIEQFSGFQVVGNDCKKRKLPRGTHVFIGYSESFTEEFVIRKWRKYKLGAFIGFDFRNKIDKKFFIEKGIFWDGSLPDGRMVVSIDDIVGYRVIDNSNGSEIGTINEIWEMPANDVWLVQTPQGNIPFPVIDDVVKNINYLGKTVNVVVLPGLMDLGNLNKIEN